ncbi:hypothetical protein NLJ89_g4576 [Agrocybe chaxingu]|uniref:Uncharacterized protein n=1 Tax=Agrocybe chaxingu TaxID=84603 RepID=A0A9W8K3T0_9AGAR|nr:hypothetical protein NLJ89_g4576 [Agrocybe chaxingu]
MAAAAPNVQPDFAALSAHLIGAATEINRITQIQPNMLNDLRTHLVGSITAAKTELRADIATVEARIRNEIRDQSHLSIIRIYNACSMANAAIRYPSNLNHNNMPTTKAELPNLDHQRAVVLAGQLNLEFNANIPTPALCTLIIEHLCAF